MSQKVSPVSVRLYNYRGFDYTGYSNLHYISLWKKNLNVHCQSQQVLTEYGYLKIRRSQINRRLRLKHNLTRGYMHNHSRINIHNIPYKTSCYQWYFKLPLNGIQHSYSIRSIRKREK